MLFLYFAEGRKEGKGEKEEEKKEYLTAPHPRHKANTPAKKPSQSSRPGLPGLGLPRPGFASAGFVWARFAWAGVCLGWGLPRLGLAPRDSRLSSLPLVLEASGVGSELTGGPALPSLRPSSVSEDSGSSLNPSRPVGPHRVQETYHHVCK